MPNERETKEFGANVPIGEYEEFRENFPQYGATNWFINTALASFNRQVRANRTLKTLIDDSIEEMLQVNRLIGRDIG